jgi:hypothetical protein
MGFGKFSRGNIGKEENLKYLLNYHMDCKLQICNLLDK